MSTWWFLALCTMACAQDTGEESPPDTPDSVAEFDHDATPATAGDATPATAEKPAVDPALVAWCLEHDCQERGPQLPPPDQGAALADPPPAPQVVVKPAPTVERLEQRVDHQIEQVEALIEAMRKVEKGGATDTTATQADDGGS